MKLVSFLALMLVRALIFSLVGIIGAAGFIMLCPFPSFWRELRSQDRGYAQDKA